MYQRMYHPPLRSPLSLLSASPKHIHTGFYPPSRSRLYYLPTIYIYIYTYESIKCRLCLSGTKTLKLQIIGHFSCLSDSVLRVQLRRRDTRRKEQRRNRDPFVFVKKEKNFKAGAARVSATRGSLSIISALLDFRARAMDTSLPKLVPSYFVYLAIRFRRPELFSTLIGHDTRLIPIFQKFPNISTLSSAFL